MADESTKASKKFIELFITDSNNTVHHKGPCKILINRYTKEFSIKLKNEETEVANFQFASEFIPQKNILCIFGTKESNKNASLVFDSEEKCKKVYNLITKNNAKINIYKMKEKFVENFLIPLFKTAMNSDGAPEIMIQLADDFGNRCSDKERNEFAKMIIEKVNNKKAQNGETLENYVSTLTKIKKQKINSNTTSGNDTDTSESTKDGSKKIYNLRKRTHQNMSYLDNLYSDSESDYKEAENESQDDSFDEKNARTDEEIDLEFCK